MTRNIILISLFILCEGLVAQEIPPIQHYRDQISFAGNQNWMITQDDQGTIYAANNKGLLQFSGTDWKLNTSPNQSIIRSVKVIDDKICVGSYMDFGYWEHSSNGELFYTSLAKELDIDVLEDEQFWNIIDYGEKIIFQSLNRLIIIDIGNKKSQFVQTDNTLLKSYKVGNQIYFQEAGIGLFEVRSGKAFLVNDNKILKDNVIVGIYKKEGKLLILTDQSGFFFLENNRLKKWKIEGETSFEGIKLYSSLKLSDGSFVLGSIAYGLIWIDSQGKTIIELNVANGISNNTILTLFEDRYHNLWLGLDNGMDCINIDSPFLEYNDNIGKIGAVYASAKKGIYFYLGTNHGLYYRVNNDNSDFKLIKGTEGQVWSLFDFEGDLLCGHDLGTYYVEGSNANKISDVGGTWTFKKHPKFDNLLLQGNYNGINVLQKINNQWSFKNKLEGFNISSRYFEIINDTTLLVGHEYKGIFKLSINKAVDKVIQTQIDTSVEKGIHASLAKFDNEIFYFSPEGIFKYDTIEFEFVKDSLLSDQIKPEEYITGKMINDSNGRLWMFSKNQIHFLRREVFSEQLKFESIFFENNTRKNVLGFEHISKYDDSKYLIASGMGYLLIDTDKIKKIQPKIRICNIEVKDNTQSTTSIVLLDEFELDYEKNNIKFYYTATNYQKHQQVKYQFRLEGYDLLWSPWSENTDVSYSNLSSGDYVFSVRSKIGDQTSEVTQFNFQIKPPWHLSRWMYFVYIIIFISLLSIINRLYDAFYERERKKLIKRNQRKLQINDLASQRKLMKIRNEQLQNDIENKNREIAIATMSTAKRNEFLNKIINELKTLDPHPRIDRLTKMINKNLKGNEDWEFFEKAFNNADKDFFKKVKKAHPTLTHNDLRLCAFLRLNLLSKEIAPLLNISVRSVEIKRYRLRKKMKLSRDESIVDHFVNL
ncbi:MAG: triple tyrosine motif-containing protein [Flavobacteriaceae bacterium]